jgi:hypothetical protein
MKGKNKCKILKEIRQKIADENDIPYVTRECSYQGDCLGTCPKCEAELRYLEQELEKRRSLGKSVAVAAVAAGLSLSLAACTPGNGSGGSGMNTPTLPTPKPPISTGLDGDFPEPIQTAGVPTEPLMGKFLQETEPTEEVLMGEMAPETEPQELEGEPVPPELMGDVVYLPGSLPVDGIPVDQVPETTEAR